MQLVDTYHYHGPYGQLTYVLHVENWRFHIGKNDPSNCKLGTKKTMYQEIMLFD